MNLPSSKLFRNSVFCTWFRTLSTQKPIMELFSNPNQRCHLLSLPRTAPKVPSHQRSTWFVASWHRSHDAFACLFILFVTLRNFTKSFSILSTIQKSNRFLWLQRSHRWSQRGFLHFQSSWSLPNPLLSSRRRHSISRRFVSRPTQTPLSDSPQLSHSTLKTIPATAARCSRRFFFHRLRLLLGATSQPNVVLCAAGIERWLVLAVCFAASTSLLCESAEFGWFLAAFERSNAGPFVPGRAWGAALEEI